MFNGAKNSISVGLYYNRLNDYVCIYLIDYIVNLVKCFDLSISAYL